jgi:hypothetical protein
MPKRSIEMVVSIPSEPFTGAPPRRATIGKTAARGFLHVSLSQPTEEDLKKHTLHLDFFDQARAAGGSRND